MVQVQVLSFPLIKGKLMNKQIQRIKFINKCKKIAVFSTSEIQGFDYRNNSSEIVSTGLLESALSQKYTVYVITTRTNFRDDIDSWWQSKVKKIYTGYTGYGANDKGFIQSWKTLYTDLGIDLNLLVLSYRNNQEYFLDSQSWLDYQNNLSRFGIKRGRDFLPKK